uniref:Ig-like domain-containing protein n=1 Tax=Kryptolebias marmoratus TaxID=37003 RepID=A0A3Q3B221_KRYMA
LTGPKILQFMRNTGLAALTQPSFFHFKMVNVGQNVTLKCFSQGSSGMIFYWYKQTQGQKPQVVSEFLKHASTVSLKDEFRNDPRFDLEYGGGKYHLKISNAQLSDSANYFCVRGQSFKYEFLEGAVVHVKGSGLNIQTVVHRSGDSVTLSCTVQTGSCDGEHSVYWFKGSDESHSGLIYTHGGSNDECKMKPNTQTHTCLYNLPLKNVNESHAGTYYCAVASCGQILFGNRTTLDFEEKVDSPVLVYVLSGALAFTITLLVFLACITYKLYKTTSCKCKGRLAFILCHACLTCEVAKNAAGLHYAALSENLREPGSQRNSSCDCVYSTVK